MQQRLIFLFLCSMLMACSGKPANAPPTVSVQALQQNWSPQTRQAYYQQSIGSEILPYAWFAALEQPQWSLNPFAEIPRFAELNNLRRFGFLPADPAVPNAQGLPVGLVKDERFVDPQTGQARTTLGLTCAACHTGQLEVMAADQQRIGLRIDGGSAQLDLNSFEAALNEALLFTDQMPLRFERFAERVLGDKYSRQTKAALKQEFDARLDKIRHEKQLFVEFAKTHPGPGFGRLDTLNRIANTLMNVPYGRVDNTLSNAPVNFPPIWETPWFDYGHYNGSALNPLLRNLVKALWAKTPVVLTGDAQNRFKSAAQLDSLFAIESLLSGDAPYRGLHSPAWPEATLGAIDQAKAANGARLYAQYCASCHLPSKGVLLADADSEAPVYWTSQNHLGLPLLRIANIPLETIGTDPQQALGFSRNTVNLGAAVGATVVSEMSLFTALDFITQQVAERYFIANNISDAQQIEWGNGHKVAVDEQHITVGYNAVPLSGIWATPPYLHNGSVPSLYALLSPVSERPSVFGVGARLYDPVNVGYFPDASAEAYPFDTHTEGNHNTGHEFNDGQGAGIIGPKLSEEERRDLLEYLKTF